MCNLLNGYAVYLRGLLRAWCSRDVSGHCHDFGEVCARDMSVIEALGGRELDDTCCRKKVRK